MQKVFILVAAVALAAVFGFASKEMMALAKSTLRQLVK